jgi:hypothetical protein
MQAGEWKNRRRENFHIPLFSFLGELAQTCLSLVVVIPSFCSHGNVLLELYPGPFIVYFTLVPTSSVWNVRLLR